MARGINKWIGVGNLCSDPETRYAPSGSAITNATMACNNSYKDKSGKVVDTTEFVKLVFYNKLAEIAGEYLRKGSLAYVEGELRTRKWQDKSGADRYTTEIICNEMQMLGGRPESANTGQDQHNQAKSNGYQPQSDAGTGGDDPFDDDIPF